MTRLTNQAAGRAAICVALLSALLLAAAPARAGTPGVTVLHPFGYQPDGEYPEGRLVQGSDGTLYGTTNGGGVNGYGMAFGIKPDGSGFTTLHSFTGNDGQQLYEGMTFGSDGNLYGTTPQGTVCVNSSCTGFGGSVFRLTTAGALTTLHYFHGNGAPDGNVPGDLTDGGDGFFYGTTQYGGAAGVNGLGTVFKIGPNGRFTTLHSFTAGEPFYPLPGLTRGADGNFYGATQYTVGNNNGAIFKVTPAGVVSTVHTFSGADGSGPHGKLLLASDGNFYGTTGGGGANGAGTVFKLTPGGTLTTLYAFNGSDGSGPAAGLVQTADGNFYGVTGGGGDSNQGTIFRITPAGVLTTLHVFEFADGYAPSVGPILGSDGLLYGTTTQGGSGGSDSFPTGTVYRFDPTAVQPPVLTMTKFCINEFDECFAPYDSYPGGYVAISWFSANVSNCFATGDWHGAQASGGYLEFQTTTRGRYVYRLTCGSANGPLTSSVTITVGP